MANKSESINVKDYCAELKGMGDIPVQRIEDAKPERINPSRSLSFSVDIDVSDAFKGLKAVQREAKKTARALREVEGMSPEEAIKKLTDDEIFYELSKRGWDSETAVLNDGFGNPKMSSVNMHKNYKS